MKAIALDLNQHGRANIQGALEDTANSIAEGHGAGTLTDPAVDGNADGYRDEDYLGFWTGYPTSWESSEIDLLIELDADATSAEAAAAVRSITVGNSTAGDVIVFGHKVGRWELRNA
jgi:hypothetical protein